MREHLPEDQRPSPEQIEEILRARAEVLARRRDEDESLHEEDEVLLVRAGELRCAIGLTEIDRVVAVDELTPLPNAPALAAGLAYVEGQILTVVDLARALGGRSKKVNAILLCTAGEDTLALGVDAYLGVQPLPAAALGPPPSPLQGPAARYLLSVTNDGIARLQTAVLLKDLLSSESEGNHERVE